MKDDAKLELNVPRGVLTAEMHCLGGVQCEQRMETKTDEQKLLTRMGI